MIANVLSIAGSDPSGGAGIQADLKTFGALGVYGMAAITALTAQNTQGVRSFVAMEPEFVAAQIDAVFEDVRVDAVKIGMVANAGIARAVAARLKAHGARNIVLDPVMVAKSGDPLLAPEAVAAVREDLVPLASVVTPNRPEAAVLIGTREIATIDEMRARLPELRRLGARWTLLKGGHLEGGDSVDLLDEAATGRTVALSAARIATKNSHGTGCTLSAALAASLPGRDVEAAARRAKDYLTHALAAADQLTVGSGHGPLNHFFDLT
jgi:hydroxymethylpyrimidine/phosphomethylpyrimidine kinase